MLDLSTGQKVVDEASELGITLRNFFADWLREGVSTWFQHWENGVIVWTHVLFRNDTAGWEARQSTEKQQDMFVITMVFQCMI